MSDPHTTETTSLNRIEEIASSCIAAPYVFFSQSIRLLGRTTASIFSTRGKDDPVEKERKQLASEIPYITSDPLFIIADRTQAVQRGDTKLSLYQYYKLKQIRIIAKRNGMTKEKIFTPNEASKSGYSYCLDGAVMWAIKNGFVGAPAPTIPRESLPQPVVEVVAAPPKMEVPQVHQPPEPQPLKDLNPAPAQSSNKKLQPFTGYIQRFGFVKKKDHEKNKYYTTYEMVLTTAANTFEKSFIGEQLGELVEEMNLQRGQQVTITPLGVRYFEVEIGNGKKEQRRRNEYSIQI